MINRQDPMVAAVVGYRLMHGEWPTLVRHGALGQRLPIHDDIAKRVEMIPARDGTSWIAEGEEGRQFKFSEESLVPMSARTHGLLVRWLTPSVLIRDSLLEVATMLYDRGLAFGMAVEPCDGGVMVTKAGADPEGAFHRVDFEAVGAGGSTVPSMFGRRKTVFQALAAMGEEHGALAETVLARRPVLAGSAELEQLLHSSLAGAARRARMNANQLMGHAMNRVWAFRDMSNGVSSAWKAEVQGALTWLATLEYEAGLNYHGIIGPPCESYADLGARVRGIGEERAFRYLEAFDAHVRRLRPPLPVTQAAVRVLKRFGKPVLLERWWRALSEPIRPESAAGLAAIGALGDWGWIRSVTIQPCAGTYVAGLDADTVRSYAAGIAAVFDDLHDWGVASVRTAARLARLSIRETRSVLERDPRWTAASRDWFIRGGRGGGTLVARARGISSCDACSTLDDLHRLLANDESLQEVLAARKACEMPPADVLGMMIGLGKVRLKQKAA